MYMLTEEQFIWQKTRYGNINRIELNQASLVMSHYCGTSKMGHVIKNNFKKVAFGALPKNVSLV